MSKPSVLIAGGTGFVGRNLVKYLVDNDLCAAIRVVDKVLPEMSNLTAEQEAAFAHATVEFKQGDLSREGNAQKQLLKADGSPFNFVVNCAAEAKYGQDKSAYDKNTVAVARVVSTEAKAVGVEKLVHVSHAGVYESKSGKSTESSKLGPWTAAYTAALEAEEVVKASGVPLVILRPAITYGVGDINGLCPRLICARVYKHLNKTMKFLWSKDLQINTVHVQDVAKAVWHALVNLPDGAVYNLADKSSTSQGSLNAELEKIFGISTGFQNAMVSKAAGTMMKTAAAHINEDHMEPWGELCKANNILNTPLSPYLDVELLYNKHMSIDGSAIEATGFVYDRPEVTQAHLEEQLAAYKSLNLFP